MSLWETLLCIVVAVLSMGWLMSAGATSYIRVRQAGASDTGRLVEAALGIGEHLVERLGKRDEPKDDDDGTG